MSDGPVTVTEDCTCKALHDTHRSALRERNIEHKHDPCSMRCSACCSTGWPLWEDA